MFIRLIRKFIKCINCSLTSLCLANHPIICIIIIVNNNNNNYYCLLPDIVLLSVLFGRFQCFVAFKLKHSFLIQPKIIKLHNLVNKKYTE